MSTNTPPADDRELRNAVFAARQATESGGIPMISRDDAARKELNIEIPTAVVPLPSRGLVYPSDSPLYNKDQLEIKGMTASEENILMSRALIKKGTVITELIKACMIDPRIDVNSMLSGDRNALMVAIRITGYGSEYIVPVECPKCESRKEYHINLSDLDIKFIEVEPSVPGQNAFSFTLPVTKKVVTFKFLTGKEEEEIVATAEARKKKGLQSDVAITTRLQYSIIAVDGNTDRSYISKFAQYMPARDSLSLRHYIDENEPGIEMKFPFECQNAECGHSEVMTVPMGPSFFWPGS